MKTYKAKIKEIQHELLLVINKYKINETRPMELKYINGYQDGLALALSILNDHLTPIDLK